jgi:hypothetical protein
MELLIGLAIFLILLVVAIPIIFLIVGGSVGLAILLIMLAMVIFIPIIIVAGFVRRYAYYYLVLSDLKIRPAIENAYAIFRKNILSSFVTVLVLIPFSIVMLLFILAALIAIGLVFLILGVIVYFLLPKIILYAIIGIGIFIFAAIAIWARSILEVFSQSFWFLFFHQIATKKEAEETVVEPSVLGEKISEAAGAYKAQEK